MYVSRALLEAGQMVISLASSHLADSQTLSGNTSCLKRGITNLILIGNIISRVLGGFYIDCARIRWSLLLVRTHLGSIQASVLALLVMDCC